MSFTWNSWIRLPYRSITSSGFSMPPPLVAQYRSSWKTTFRGSVFAARMSNTVWSPNESSNSMSWLCTISVWPACRASAPSSFRYSAYATHWASVV